MTDSHRRRLRRLFFAPLLCALAIQGAAQPQTNTIAAGKTDGIKPTPQPAWSFVSSVLRAPEKPDQSRRQELRALLNELSTLSQDQITGAKGGNPRTDLVIRLYKALPFETVRELAAHKITIGGEEFELKNEHSVALAIVRDHMINEVYKMMCERYGMDFIRLDFGNKLSGLKSDVDHTAHAAWKQLEAAIRAQAAEGKVQAPVRDIRDAFEQLYHSRWNISQEACDICIHSGKNSIPDWRHAQSVAEFDARMREVLGGLIRTPDAYFQEGAWRMQVEMRSIAGAEAVTRSLHEIETELKDPQLTEERRAELEAKMAKVREGNPCTKFSLGPDKKAVADKDASILDALFVGVNRDVLRLYAFDSCVGNFLFFLHHADKWNYAKYPLRSFEEGVSLLRDTSKDGVVYQFLDKFKPKEEARPGGAAQGEAPELKPIVYSTLTPQGRDALIRDLYTEQFGFDEAKRQQIRRLLDVTAALRDNHKAPKAEQLTETQLWKPIIDQLRAAGRGEGLDEAKMVEIAKEEYNRASVEMMVWNNELTSQVRTVSWLEPTKSPVLTAHVATIRAEKHFKNVTPQNQAQMVQDTTTRLQFSSYYAIKTAFRYMTREQVNRLIESQPEKYRNDLRIVDRVIDTELKVYGRTLLEAERPAEAVKPLHEQMKEAAREVWDGWGKRHVDFWKAVGENYYSPEAITERTWESIYETLGFERKVTREILKVHSSKWGEGVWEVKTGPLEWNVDRAFGSFINAGNALSALNVMRVYQQGGDRDEVIGALVCEGIYRLPGAIHIVALKDAYHGDWHGVKFLVTSKILDKMKEFAVNRRYGWAAPLSGHALIYFLVAKGAIEMVGYEIFEPLKTDAADLMYLGRIARPAPPSEFTKEDGRRLSYLQGLIEDNREKILDLQFNSPEMKKVLDETRKHLASVRELDAKQKAWEDHKKALERYDAGILRAGIKDPVEAGAFDPILHEKNIPLKFYIGRIEGDVGGPVDLAVKALSQTELGRAESLRQIIKGIEGGSQGLPLPDRIKRLLAAREELRELESRQRGAERAARYLEKIRSDPEMRIDALRQNLVFMIKPIVDGKLKVQGFQGEDVMAGKSAEEYQRFSHMRDQAAVSAVGQYAQRWFDEQHPQTKNLAGLQEALVQVKARMVADYKHSRDAFDQFEDFQFAQKEAFREQQKAEGLFLEMRAAQEALSAFLEKAAEDCLDAGFLVLADGAPKEQKAIVRLSGHLEGEGEEKRLKGRVKVIASAFDYPPPYKVEIRTKGGNKRSDNNKEVIFFAEVRDANGKMVGTSQDVPASLKKGEEAEPLAPKLALGICDWGNTNNHGAFEGVVLHLSHDGLTGAPKEGVAKSDRPPGDRFNLYRARSPTGPWLRLPGRTYRDAPFISGPGNEGAKYSPDSNATLDDFPSAFTGSQEWHYTAIPKREVGASDTDVLAALTPEQCASMNVSISLPPPILKMGTGRIPGRLTPEEAIAKETEARGGAPVSPEDAAIRAETEAFFGKRDESEGWISWAEPSLPPPLDKTRPEQRYIQVCVSAPPGDPELDGGTLKSDHRTFMLDGYAPGWIWPQMHWKAGIYPGMPYKLKARWIARTFGGTVASEWSENSFTAPPMKFSGMGNAISLAAGQAIQITCVKALLTGDPKDGFTPYGAGGINQGEHRAKSDKDRKETIDGFWRWHDKPGDREGERGAKLQRELDVRLKKEAYRHTDWQVAHARLPGAPLGALIGEFVSDAARKAYDEEQKKKREAEAAAPKPEQQQQRKPPEEETPESVPEDPFADQDKGPKATYFMIGKGASFAAPEPGTLNLTWNWPVHGGTGWGSLKQLLYTVAFTQVGEPPAAPPPGPPQWERMAPATGGDSGKWQFTMKAPAPAEGVELLPYAAAEEAGPWKEARYDREQDGSLIIRDGGLAPGHRAWYRTRATKRGNARCAVVSWSPPVEVRLDPQASELRTTGRLAFFGKRNQVLRISASGDWQPVQVEGTNITYGADGVGDEVLIEPLRAKLDAQFEQQKKQPTKSPTITREEATQELAKLRQQKSAMAATMSAEDKTLFDKIEKALDAIAKGENPETVLGASSGPSAPDPARHLSNMRHDLESPCDPFGCLLGVFEPTPPLPGGDLYQRPGGFSAPDRTTFRAGAQWEFRFPEDGVLNLMANKIRYKKQGAFIVEGTGTLTVNATFSGQGE